jgi:hypothetical protein
MVRLLLSSAAAIAACTPSPQENAMHPQNSQPAAAAQAAPAESQAALAPVPEPVPVTANPLPADSPAAAEGRRALSTAFVRVGPDGHLTVELRDGRMLVLRDVTMGPKDYCGVQVAGGKAGARYCGGYADVAAARPGG